MIATVRGRKIREPILWALGALVAFFTPLVWLPMLALFSLGSRTDSVLPPIALVALVMAGLTWWAWRARTGLARRAWSIGLWFVLLIGAFVLVGSAAAALFEATGISYSGKLGTVLGLVAGVAFIASGVAFAPFVLRAGEFLFDRRSPGTP